MSDTPETGKAERMVDELRSIVDQRLVTGATIHQNANDLMRRNEQLESERDELLGVIKSLRKNAKEDAKKHDNSIKIIKLLIQEIEGPEYHPDNALEKLNIIEYAKKISE